MIFHICLKLACVNVLKIPCLVERVLNVTQSKVIRFFCPPAACISSSRILCSLTHFLKAYCSTCFKKERCFALQNFRSLFPSLIVIVIIWSFSPSHQHGIACYSGCPLLCSDTHSTIWRASHNETHHHHWISWKETTKVKGAHFLCSCETFILQILKHKWKCSSAKLTEPL